jgi:hypothetical protein
MSIRSVVSPKIRITSHGGATGPVFDKGILVGAWTILLSMPIRNHGLSLRNISI